MIKFNQIARNLLDLSFGCGGIDFVTSFLRAFEFPESTITRLQLDYSEGNRIIELKKKVLFIFSSSGAFHLELESFIEKGVGSIDERYIVIYNSTHLLSYDVKTKESLKTSIQETYQYLEFFLPLLGQEKVITDRHQSADIKTAEKLASIYNELILHPNFKSHNSKKDLDLTISRLLFCFWIDSLELLGDGKLKRILINHTHEDGTNAHSILNMVFEILRDGSQPNNQSEFKELLQIPIELFSEEISTPQFSRKARKLLVELSSVDWSDINPDILGSLIQSIIDPDDNTGLSNHYTSSSNILKVIGPLFLDDLYQEFDQNKDSIEGLNSLSKKIKTLKIFDPSCGAGNFLIISLKELNLLRSAIVERVLELKGRPLKYAMMDLSQFYGVEENYFKLQIAKIGLCIESFKSNKAENMTISEIVIRINDLNMLNANPTQVDWSSFCKSEKHKSVFILSNPTYRGARKQTPKQKSDVAKVFNKYENTKNLDYSSCWLYLASKYIELNNAKCAIVTTNSLTQGEQVELLWPKIFSHNVEICFARTSFKWKNSSKGNTGVTIVIIGLSRKQTAKEKKLFGNEFLIRTDVISPYLTSGINVIVKKRRQPIANLPPMPKGNMPYDGGNLILSKTEKENLLNEFPTSSKFLKRLLGSKEFIQGIERWCLWIQDKDLEEAISIRPIQNRIQKVYNLRKNSVDKGAQRLADRPHQFREINCTTTNSIIIPSVSSEKRQYIPIGFVDESVIITNLAFAIYDCEPWIFGLLTSKMHNLWIKAVCGSLETRIRYSSSLGYNTFPFPVITENYKQKINSCVFEIIAEEENFPEKTLSYLYNPETMPESLLTSHKTLDKVIEKCYQTKPFSSDHARINHLLNYYQEAS